MVVSGYRSVWQGYGEGEIDLTSPVVVSLCYSLPCPYSDDDL